MSIFDLNQFKHHHTNAEIKFVSRYLRLEVYFNQDLKAKIKYMTFLVFSTRF